MKRIALNLLLSAVFVVPGAAPALGQTNVLTLDEALSIATGTTVPVRQAQVGQEVASTVDDQRRALWRPSLEVTAAYSLFDDESLLEIPNLIEPLAPYLAAAAALNPSLPPVDSLPGPGEPEVIRHQHDVRATATVTQPVFIPQAFVLGDRADAAEDEARAGLRLAREEMVKATQALYFGAVAQARLVEVAEQNVELLQLALRRVTLAEEAGVAGSFEVTRAEVALAEGERDVLSARAALAITTDTLAELLQVEPGFVVQSPPELSPDQLPPDSSPGLRAEMERWDASRRGAEADADLARAGVLPVVVVQGLATAQRETAFSDPTEFTLRVALSWEPYAGGTRRVDQRRAELAAADATLEAERTADVIAGELRRQRIRVDLADATAAQATREAELATRGAELTRLAWEAGAASFSDVEAAIDQANAAAIASATAEVQHQAELYELQRLLTAPDR